MKRRNNDGVKQQGVCDLRAQNPEAQPAGNRERKNHVIHGYSQPPDQSISPGKTLSLHYLIKAQPEGAQLPPRDW